MKGRFPDDPEIEGSLRMDLGAVLKQVGNWKESKEVYLAALPLMEKVHGGDSVEYIRVLNCLASSHQMLQENEDWLRVGSESLRKAEARLGPGNFERITAMNNVGGALGTLGKLDEAREILTRAKGLAEKDPFANRSPLANIYNWLVACEMGAKNTSAAVEMRRKNHTQLTIFQQQTNPNLGLTVWLKINTGMNRLGLLPSDIPTVWQQLKNCSAIKEIRFNDSLC